MTKDDRRMTKELHTTIYDSSNRDRLSLHAWHVMFKELYEFRELTGRLVRRNFAAQFRQSFLGYFWIILPPVAVTIVFSLLRKANVVNVPVDEDAMPYALFALVGITIWGAFTQFLSSSMASVASGGNLVSKVYFPREVLALSAVGSAMISLLVRVLVILFTFVLFLYMPSWKIVLVPIVLLPLVAMAFGFGLLFAPINTMMHDMSRVVEFVFQFGMFIVPAIFPTPDLADAHSSSQQFLYWVHVLNPVSHFINTARDLMHYGTFEWTTGYVASSILAFLILAIGWRLFHICEPLVAERL